MSFSNQLSIVLIGAVAISAIAQLTPVFAISAKVPSAAGAAGTIAENFFIQGNEKYKKGGYQGAIQAFSQAIVLNPNYAQAYNNRGIARRTLGDSQGALADFNQAPAN
ncbi:tetratricopeptide repeat protein [Microcoleus vaginatus PCC 9802]|uniref:tetratricopeptide repeat protein n=1 Tax=Microcoleus vaginatus TaxID=119532 RepID=UPI000303B7DF|nr:tetratricopeptide repeat protein [Microcoleus vaginatus PCC 9802]